MQPTLIDLVIALSLLASVLGACHRGIGREMLHTVLFGLLVGFGYLMFRSSGPVESANDVTFWVVNSSYYLITAYILTWAGLKVISQVFLGPENVGYRSRFWAGVLSIAKLAAVIFGLNLWFAMHAEEPHPKRLATLPAIMQNSVAVQISDKLTEDLYRWLAAKNIVEYKKNLYRKPTEDERTEHELKERLGIITPSN